ncbi:MAG TPA: hypothetical protein VNC40_09515 [Gaiellaceae bacterium]|nr:hypothetical protein [Gaiellaceae bacterium]
MTNPVRIAHPASLPWRELLTVAFLAEGTAVLLLAAGPAPGDAPAHLYRTLLVRDGAFVWDNLWYGGQYPFASYSLLYYLPAAIFGNLFVMFFAVLVSAVLFAVIGYHEWGHVARWPVRAFGLAAAAPLFTGLYSYSLGFMTLLAALRFLQRGRVTLTVVAAALTLGFSPLAFVFLCIVLFAVLFARRGFARRTIVLPFALAAIAGVQILALVLFPSYGIYPFNHWDLLAVLAVCTLGVLVSRRSAGARVFVVFFMAWAGASVLAFSVPSALGDNITRLRGVVFPVMLLVAAKAHFRPRVLVTVALATALAYNVVPYLMLIPYRLDPRPAHAAFWQPALGFLERNRNPDYRVEVVPTAAHWESYWLPRAGYALARGWYRQLDIVQNPVLYEDPLRAPSYAAWLHRMGIRYVVLPHTKLDPLGGPAEAQLVAGPSLGLREVFNSSTSTIYEVPDPTPLLTGAPGALVTSLTHVGVAGHVRSAGPYLLRLRFSPYWIATPSGTCVRPSHGDLTQVVLSRAGHFSLRMPGKFGSLLHALTGNGSTCRSSP